MEGIDWIHLDPVRDKWRAGKCGDEHSVSIKCGEFPD